MTVFRSHHFTDAPVSRQGRRRVISNWCNWRTPAGEWSASDPDVETAASIPYDWTGSFDFRYQSMRGPLQCFAGDSTDPINTALVGVRSSERPENWLNLKALGVQAVQPVIDREARQIAWPLLWNNTDLGFFVGRNKLRKIIRLRQSGHPNAFRFALRLPPSHTLVVVEGEYGYIKVLDDLGEEVLRSSGVNGWDSATTTLSPDGSNAIRVSLAEGEPITVGSKQFPTVWLTPNADDLDSATYPVFLDPTVQITGTSNIEDNTLRSSSFNQQWGGSSILYLLPPSDTYVAIVRCDLSTVPEGAITGFRMMVRWDNALGTETITAYIIKDANDWTEGTGTGRQATSGESTWQYCHYPYQAWAGSAGCSSSGVDYDSDLSPPTVVTVNDTQFHAFALKPEWATAWRDATRVSNGVRLSSDSAAPHILSSESGAPLYFEVDYTSGSKPFVIAALGRQIS